MENATKIVFASALALVAVLPTFANAAYLENTLHPRTTGMSAHIAKNARALDSMAYAPAESNAAYVRDFGISSQR
jgi:hypothetical protein